jgi:hypothetical protein
MLVLPQSAENGTFGAVLVSLALKEQKELLPGIEPGLRECSGWPRRDLRIPGDNRYTIEAIV